MRYTYTTLTLLKGAAPPTDGGSVILLDGSNGVRAVLAQDVESSWPLAHQLTAIANCILNRMFGGTGREMEFEEHVAFERTKICNERKGKYGTSSVFLVATFEGEHDVLVEDERELSEFFIVIDGPSSLNVRSAHEETFHALKLALALTLEGLSGLDEIDSAVAWWPASVKPLYSLSFDMSAQGTTARPIVPADLNDVSTLMPSLGDPTLQRAGRLLLASLRTSKDKLRSFLFAWTALEVFVNKVFRQCESVFFAAIDAADPTEAHASYVGRIREVMSDKYSLADRFALVSVQLRQHDADADLADFKLAKAARDDLLHGQTVDEAVLPVSIVQRLARTYIFAFASSLPGE